VEKMFKKLKNFFKNKKLLKNLMLLFVSLAVLSSGVLIVLVSSLKIPDFHSITDRKVVNSTQIYDRTGKVLLYDIHQDVKRTDIHLSQMSPNIKSATIAIEDSNFYNEGGVRISSTLRALFSNIFHIGIGGGGSTITQQLVKNTLLSSSSGFGKYLRKIKEWVLAIKIDNSLSKDAILEAYLNAIPYGGNIYGIEAASKNYFNIDATDLDLAQAAYLASIPQSPTTLSPYGKNRDKLDARKNLVLSRMLDLKIITEAQYNEAKNEVVTFIPQATMGIRAPHFVFWIQDYLEQKYGTDAVENGGMKVITTLDANLEAQAEQIVKDGALANEKTWNASNAALVAIDPKTGQILAMVGSRDYFDKTIEGNFNVATATRQPGSSFKPFIYATAFNEGFTPDTVLFDLPTEFQTTCDAYGKALPGHNQSDCYMPQDFDGKTRGPMSLRNALAQSINIPAVKLFYLTGQQNSLNTAENMGISTLGSAGQYGLTLVIGGGEVSLLDMTSAYGVFANDGLKNPDTGILQVQDLNGNILEQYQPNQQQILPKNTALTISDILSDETAREPTFGYHSALYLPGRDVAVKTGTTNNDKDAWTIGYTPSLVVGVWAGNNDDTPMKSGGSAVAAPIWNKFMTTALASLPNETFEKPNLETDPTLVKPVLRGFWQGNDNFFIDKTTGLLANSDTPKETLEEKVVTNVHSILYWVDKNNILGPPPENPDNDPQFEHWEIPVQNWWTQNKNKYPIVITADKPTETDNLHTDQNKPVVSIVSPNTTTTYPPDKKISLQISSSGSFPLQRMDVFINDVYLETIVPPFSFSFIPENLGNLQTTNELKIISYDTQNNSSETDSVFKVTN
jgi:penicillin-binding protein 1C